MVLEVAKSEILKVLLKDIIVSSDRHDPPIKSHFCLQFYVHECILSLRSQVKFATGSHESHDQIQQNFMCRCVNYI